ncbi:MAG TPA: precorrin-8X methylmutase [Candidatus Nitrosopolaris sp.]|nr:precorrin-8X methylmutase [Candidatus Nitrosopolaris sp.]
MKKKDLDNSDQRAETAFNRGMAERAFNIERKSFEIIDSEVGDHDYNRLEWDIVRRVIHATADFDFVTTAKIIFRNDALASGFNAMKNKCTIVTDVDMVLAALNKKSLSALGLNAVCHISNKTFIERSRRLNKTRSEMAMRQSANEMNEGIVLIGNAPTALFETIKMISEGATKPALVIGMPVGFVSAPESKEELSRTKIPFITNSGRKGGSAAASSIMNALMLLLQNSHHL